MKCKECNGNIQFGEAVCSHCGAPTGLTAKEASTASTFANKNKVNHNKPNATKRAVSQEDETKVVKISQAALNNYSIDMIRFVDATVTPGFQGESVFANEIIRRLNILLKQEKVDAKTSLETALLDTYRHPLIRVSNDAYGAIGLLVSKNIVSVLKLRDGRITATLKRFENEKARLKAESDYRDSKIGNSGGGLLGFASDMYNIDASSKAHSRAMDIGSNYHYDPTELLFEQAWEKDVIKCINMIGNDELFA